MKEERKKQLESLIRTKIDAIIREELDDPRLKLMSIIDIKLSREFDVASVFISHPGDPTIRGEVEKILRNASGFIEAKLRGAMRLRKIPKLNFKLDDSMIYGARIDKLIESIQKERNESETNDTGDKKSDERKK